MHEDDEEVDMRTNEELMMQHRYMMVSLAPTSLLLCSHCCMDHGMSSAGAPSAWLP